MCSHDYKRGEEFVYRVKYLKEGQLNISPIREYQLESCLSCEEKGKCDYDRTVLCVLIRLYDLKRYQMGQSQERDRSVEERLGKKE